MLISCLAERARMIKKMGHGAYLTQSQRIDAFHFLFVNNCHLHLKRGKHI